MTYAEKTIERARETKKYFAKLYNVSLSSVIWYGGERYIVCKDGAEIKIGFGG